MKRRTELRKIEFVRGFTKHAAGSVLVKWGDTWVLCTASVEDKVPPFLKDTGRGWVTAEYSMLPSSTGGGRKDRDIKKLRQDARSTEIQRLIGRSLRAAVDMAKLGPRQITIDCDVLQADGGTRCASITGGMVAIQDAVEKLLADGTLAESPIVHRVAAVSVGVCDGKPTLDLDYAHDSTAARLHGGGRPQRRDDRRRALRGAAGHRRAQAVHGGVAGRAALARPKGD